ncbi:MAG: competence/damage-inducible protein A [Dehalococcoidia bacterium]
MRAEILSIGTEIMFGEITDTNAAYIASALPEYGIDLLWVTQVGDNPGRLREAFARAWERSEITFCTGGLGPTEDDITRETIAEVLGEPLAIDAEQERVLRARFAERSVREMPPRNIKQAALIRSARAIPNPRGTAPGWWVEREGPAGRRIIVVMPGPPAEMHHMWDAEVAPELERRADSILVARTLKTTGLGESTIDEMLSPLLSGTNPSIGIYARADGVSARIAAKAKTREEAWALIRPVEEEARRILGPAIWGQDDDSLAAGVGRLLREQGLTLGLMESASAGAIASAITDVEGASDYFKGSLVTYWTEVKVAQGVPAEVPARHGVISRETAEAMARAARERLQVDLALSVTGIAGGEPLEGQPPGTMHLALFDGTRMEYTTFRYFQGREQAKRRIVQQALGMLRGYLMERAARG